jgi:hypothetical protein
LDFDFSNPYSYFIKIYYISILNTINMTKTFINIIMLILLLSALIVQIIMKDYVITTLILWLYVILTSVRSIIEKRKEY